MVIVEITGSGKIELNYRIGLKNFDLPKNFLKINFNQK